MTSDTLPYDKALTATVDTHIIVEEILSPQFSPTVRQENPDDDFGNDELEAVGIGGVGIGEGEMKGQLNSGCSGNGKRNEKTPRRIERE